MRVNFNIDNDTYKKFRIFVIENGYKSMTALFKIWIEKALEMQNKKEA